MPKPLTRRPFLKTALAMVCAPFLLLTYPAGISHAATELTEIQKLSFGKFSLKTRGTAQTLTVDAATNMKTVSTGLVIDIPAERGVYRLTGFAPGTMIDVTLHPGQMRLNGSGAQAFTIIDYTISPDNLVADDSGRAEFYVGATLRTMGDSVNYPTGIYNDELDIQFDWIE